MQIFYIPSTHATIKCILDKLSARLRHMDDYPNQREHYLNGQVCVYSNVNDLRPFVVTDSMQEALELCVKLAKNYYTTS